MKDLIIMSKKENDQISVFEQLKNGLISQVQAAFILKLSLRQIKRKLKKYFNIGPKSLVHGNRVKTSNNKLDSELYLKILNILKGEFKSFWSNVCN
jgi:hypothetical protein